MTTQSRTFWRRLSRVPAFVDAEQRQSQEIDQQGVEDRDQAG